MSGISEYDFENDREVSIADRLREKQKELAEVMERYGVATFYKMQDMIPLCEE